MSSKEVVKKHHSNATEVIENNIYKIVIGEKVVAEGTNSTIAWFNAKCILNLHTRKRKAK